MVWILWRVHDSVLYTIYLQTSSCYRITYNSFIQRLPSSVLDFNAHSIFGYLGLKFEDFIYIGSHCYFEIDSGVYMVDIDGIIAPASMTFVMICSLLCILTLAITTFLKIRKSLKTFTVSRKYNHLQTQTFYALVAQTLIPVIFMHVPSTTVFAATLLNIDLANLSGVISITIALFPALDPLPAMLIIKNYRVALCSAMEVIIKSIVRR